MHPTRCASSTIVLQGLAICGALFQAVILKAMHAGITNFSSLKSSHQCLRTMQAGESQSGARAKAAEQRVQQLAAEVEQLQDAQSNSEEERGSLQAQVSSLSSSLETAQVICCCCIRKAWLVVIVCHVSHSANGIAALGMKAGFSRLCDACPPCFVSKLADVAGSYTPTSSFCNAKHHRVS